MKYYVISDTHFGHTKIIEYCKRPVNHERLLMESMNNIPVDACLVHLGDICIGDSGMWHEFIANLPYKKVLVMGNHDPKSASWYMENGWSFVCESFKLKYCGKTICFSHKPQPWDGDWDINVHGHLHNLGHHDNDYKELKKWHRLYAPELYDYKPIELSKLIQIFPQ